ncbi:hypothetical protein [Streptomyces galilaeus]|uniref:hypothetical protein n=1 Tax=Streptomyces galilaeus TaxID=33899 RepID=UPI00167B79CD|nr:hypothetical protein [Streptomyces galilaeus]GGW50827.1 hypothetical protein GCM10010350_38990 [Streptomyces galilaeus]
MSDAPAPGIARGGSGRVAAACTDAADAPETGRPATAVLGVPHTAGPPPEPADRLRNTYRSMPEAERSALWRQRLHEAESGLTRLLATRPDTPLPDWFALQSEIFADLPDAATGSSRDWQRVFFRGQALMERFLVSRYGEDALTTWARSIAEVHRAVEPDHGRGAADPVHRIARQAELYGSDYEFDDGVEGDGQTRAALTLTHCAIWDYREQARRSGVRLTLASPCAYCTKALSENIRAKGFEPSHSLRTGPTGHGCRWEVTVPASADTPSSSSSSRER